MLPKQTLPLELKSYKMAVELGSDLVGIPYHLLHDTEGQDPSKTPKKAVEALSSPRHPSINHSVGSKAPSSSQVENTILTPARRISFPSPKRIGADLLIARQSILDQYHENLNPDTAL